MPVERIKYEDVLRIGTDKLNTAIDAVNGFQKQVDTIVVEGDSSVEAAQARIEPDGTINPTLKARLDKKESEFTVKLAEKASREKVDSIEVTKAEKTQVDQLSNTMATFQAGQIAGLTDAETLALLAIATDSNGKTFATPAARIDGIEHLVKSQSILQFNDWTIGAITNGVDVVNATRLKNLEYHRFDIGDLLRLVPNVGYKTAYNAYDESFTWKEASTWTTSPLEVEVKYPYYRFVIADTNDTNASLNYVTQVSFYVIPSTKDFITSRKSHYNWDFYNTNSRISEIENVVNDYFDKKFFFKWSVGTIGTGTLMLAKSSSDTVSPKRMVTESINHLESNLKVSTDYSKFRFVVHYYNAIGTWLSDSGWKTSDYTIPANSYFRIVLATLADTVVVKYLYGDMFKALSVVVQDSIIYNQEFDDVVTVSAHRGYNKNVPENTLVAFEKAKDLGFAYIEFDVRFTSDNIPVILHDPSINRTARNADGTAVSGTINIDSITYSEALTYDFGLWVGADFTGTKIPTLAETLDLCRKLNLRPFVHVNITDQTQIGTIYNMVKKKGMKRKSIWIMDGTMPATHLLNLDSKAVIGVSGTASTAFIDSIVNLKNAWNNENIFMDTAYTALTQSLVDYCHSRNLEFGVYTSEIDSYILAAVNYGCISLTVNNTNVRQLLEESYYSN